MSSEPLFCLKKTSYGGRGLFALKPISKGTILLTCNAPYTHIIQGEHREKVCSHCFAYDPEWKTWDVRLDSGACATETAGAEPAGFFFCTESCRDAWNETRNVDGLLVKVDDAIEKYSKMMGEPKGGFVPCFPIGEDMVQPEEITVKHLDKAWKAAEEAFANPASCVPFLDNSEVDAARYVGSAIVRRYLEDRGAAEGLPMPMEAAWPRESSLLTWAAVLQLQTHETELIRESPGALDSHTHIYGFLSKAIIAMVPVLAPYVRTPETVRALLSRTENNTFSLQTKEGNQMFGWALYISASYFNHDCSPNVKYTRLNSSFQLSAVRDVDAGEELCVSYICTKCSVSARRSKLLSHWHFECMCERCKEELAMPYEMPDTCQSNGDGGHGLVDGRMEVPAAPAPASTPRPSVWDWRIVEGLRQLLI